MSRRPPFDSAPWRGSGWPQPSGAPCTSGRGGGDCCGHSCLYRPQVRWRRLSVGPFLAGRDMSRCGATCRHLPTRLNPRRRGLLACVDTGCFQVEKPEPDTSRGRGAQRPGVGAAGGRPARPGVRQVGRHPAAPSVCRRAAGTVPRSPSLTPLGVCHRRGCQHCTPTRWGGCAHGACQGGARHCGSHQCGSEAPAIHINFTGYGTQTAITVTAGSPAHWHGGGGHLGGGHQGGGGCGRHAHAAWD